MKFFMLFKSKQYRPFLRLLLILISLTVFGQMVKAQQEPPLTLEQVLTGLRATTSNLTIEQKNEYIIKRIKERGINFQLTTEIENDLKNAGANEELLEAIRRRYMKNSIGMEFNLIPAGAFMMGSDKNFNEKPIRKITFKYEFYIGKYEVTIGQWKKVIGDLPQRLKNADPKFRESDSQPVTSLTWYEARSFISKLNEANDGFEYRLPSEAEWEYAARAGTTTEFAFGNSLSSEQANFDGNHPAGDAAIGMFWGKTVEVGSYQPNAWGLYDMHGNVAEWVEDIYSGSYDFREMPTDGSPNLITGDATVRILRGGSWLYYGMMCRSAERTGYAPPTRANYAYGFRVVAVPKVS